MVYRQVQLKEDLPHTHTEKIIIEVYGEQTKLLDQPWMRRSTVKRSHSPCSAADAVSGVLGKRLGEISKLSCHYSSTELYIFKRRVWVDITACKLTTNCVWHWSPKIYIFSNSNSVQHCSTCFPRKPQTAHCRHRRPALVGYFPCKKRLQ